MQQAIGVIDSVIGEYVEEKRKEFEKYKRELQSTLVFEEADATIATGVRPYLCDQIQDTRQAIAVAKLLKQFLLEELEDALATENELNLMAIEAAPHPAEWNNHPSTTGEEWIEEAIDAGDQLRKQLKGEE